MAVRTFYGKCDTGAGTSAKVVVVESETITPGFQFNIGDLLVVYFTNTNETVEPTIVIYNGDTEQEVSTSNGSGKYIKTRSVNVDAVGAWDAGETVIFAYTGNNNEAVDNNAYWELINGAPSTESVYGVTKLDGNINTNISDWLAESIKPEDFTKALTPGILKKFYSSLTGSPEPGQSITLGLNWEPAETEEEMTELGTLSLTSSSGQGVTIEYPIARLIESKITQVQNTSDLHNDGHAADDPDYDISTGIKKADGEFYITNILPKDRSLYYSDSTTEPATTYKFLEPCGENNDLSLNSAGAIKLNGTNGTIVDNGLVVKGGLNIPRGPITSGAIDCDAITCGAITASGDIDANDNNIKTTGGVYGDTIYEGKDGDNNPWALKDKYSGILDLVHVSPRDPVPVSANSTSGHKYISLTREGWTPIAMAGFNFNWAESTSKGDSSYCFLWEYHITGDQLEYAIRNTKNKNVKVGIVFDVLYVKNFE